MHGAGQLKDERLLLELAAWSWLFHLAICSELVCWCNDAEVTLVLLMSASLASERGDFPVADQRLISGRDGSGSSKRDGITYRQTLALVPSCTTIKRRTV